jgi:hypothetical protein
MNYDLSPYDISVQNGYTGTKSQWLLDFSNKDPIGTGSGVQGPQGVQGPAGATGATGQGVVVGGTSGQLLSKIDNTDYNTQWIDAPTSTNNQLNQLIGVI